MKIKRSNLVAIGAFIALVIGIAALFMLTRDKVKTEKFEEGAPVATPSASSKEDLKVMLFYATWCPHCEKYLSTGKWDKFDEEVKKEKSITENVKFEKIDYDKNQALGDRYGVSAFPTIIAVDADEKVYRFQGSRDKSEDIIKFVKAALDKQTLTSTDYS